MFREDLIVGIFEIMLEQTRIVQGFLLVVTRRRARCCGFVKPLRRCNCVPMLRDAFCSWCNHAGDYTFLCHALACMFLNEGEP